MKKHIFFVLLAVFAFVSCSEDDASFEDEITLPKKEQASQTAFADDGDTGGGFMFVAKSAWSAAVSETTASRLVKVRGAASSNEVSWLKLSLNGKEAYEGDAGTITLAIVLEPNYSGKTRSAKIVITCGKAKIEVSVTQEGETEKGEVPTDPYPVTSLNLSQSTLSLDLNSTHTLTASVIPSNATIQTVVWSSNNPEVATVDPATGLVTAISAGYATVTAQSTVYETITATCELTVNDPAVPQDKLIKSIAIKGFNAMYQEDYSHLWEVTYDNRNRVVRYEETLDEYALYTFEYPNNSQVIMNDYAKGYNEPPWVTTAFLNENRYVRAMDGWSYVYNDGYIAKLVRDGKTVSDYDWENGNLVRERSIYSHDSYYKESFYPTFEKYMYTDYPNEKENLDLNMLLNGFAGPDEELFGLLGFMGKRSANLLSGDYHEAGGYGGGISEGQNYYYISRVVGTKASYEFDKEGYVSEIKSTVDWEDYKVFVKMGEDGMHTETGEEELIKSYSYDYTYTITYTK